MATETFAAPAPAFRQVQVRRTFEEVAAQVREMLFGGALRPGDRLPPERELARMLGVGRPALREALRALEVSGLIELRQGKTGGAFVAHGCQDVVSGSLSDMLRLRTVSSEQMFEARLWILSSLARPASRCIEAGEIAAMRANVKRAAQLHAAGRFNERIEVNFEFHRLLAQAARNPVALLLVDALTDALRSLIERVGSDLSPGFFANRRLLIEALEVHDEDLAAKRMEKIVRETEQTYTRLERARSESRNGSNT